MLWTYNQQHIFEGNTNNSKLDCAATAAAAQTELLALVGELAEVDLHDNRLVGLEAPHAGATHQRSALEEGVDGSRLDDELRRMTPVRPEGREEGGARPHRDYQNGRDLAPEKKTIVFFLPPKPQNPTSQNGGARLLTG